MLENRPRALPSVHNASKAAARSILADGHIVPHHCRFFNEPLTYLFYGRPAYRVQVSPDGRFSGYDYLPVAFVFDTGNYLYTRLPDISFVRGSNLVFYHFIHSILSAMVMNPFQGTPDDRAATVEMQFSSTISLECLTAIFGPHRFIDDITKEPNILVDRSDIFLDSYPTSQLLMKREDSEYHAGGLAKCMWDFLKARHLLAIRAMRELDESCQ